MAGKTNLTFTNYSGKKLLSKAHTSLAASENEELVGSSIQISAKTIFSVDIPNNPTKTLNTVQSSAVEYVELDLSPIGSSFFNANTYDAETSAQSAGYHAYYFSLKSSYELDTDNPNAGNSVFVNGKHLTGSNGLLQIVPPVFSSTSPNPYICTIYSGSRDIEDQISLTDEIDWYVDYFNGILYLQDYNSAKIPTRAKAFVYVGDMLDDTLSSLSGGSGSSVGWIASDNGTISTTGSLFIGTNTSTPSSADIYLGNSGQAVFNEQGLPVDFRIESDNKPNAFKVDGLNDKILILSGGSSLDTDRSSAPDVSFFVSGGINSQGTSYAGTSLFGGDLFVSGVIKSSTGLSGSLTRLSDGTSYIVGTGGISVTTQSNGSILLSGSFSTTPIGTNDQMLTSNGSGGISAEPNLTFNGSTLSVTGAILPGLDNTYDLGSPDKRFANVYTGDLHLQNDRGHWQIVEEADMLTIINRITGKRFKFVLEEI